MDLKVPLVARPDRGQLAHALAQALEQALLSQSSNRDQQVVAAEMNLPLPYVQAFTVVYGQGHKYSEGSVIRKSDWQAYELLH